MAPIAAILIFLMTAGCSGIDRAPSREPVQPGVTQEKAAAVEPPVANGGAASPERPQPVDKKATAVSKTDQKVGATPKMEPGVAATPPSVTAPPKAAASVPPPEQAEKTESIASVPTKKETPSDRANSVAKAELPAVKPAIKEPVPPLHAAPTQKKEAAAASVKQEPTPLDLKALEQRLKDTDAIGVFTKLTLKNQVDDLLSEFRAYYQGRSKTTLAQLRKPYEQLILKVQSLLIQGDPSLAREIIASREAIWKILADPVKFEKL